MRIALVAPPWVPVPPPAYGGTEAVVDRLARGFVAAGHEVLLSVDFGLALAMSSISTLLAGWLAVEIGPLPTLYVMLALMVVTVGPWLAWTRPLRRERSTLEPLPEPFEPCL